MLTKSAYIQNDKIIRLLNNINNRIARLEWQFTHQMKRDSIDVPLYNSHIEQLKGLADVLLTNSVICNDKYKHVYNGFKFFPETVEDHCILLFGGFIPRKEFLTKKRDYLSKLLEKDKDNERIAKLLKVEEFNIAYYLSVKKMLRRKTINARKNELATRLRYEMHFRLKQGWFCIFNTLTCDAKNISNVFNAGSTEWSDYIRLVDRSVGRKCHGSWSSALHFRNLGQEFHTYFAVVERGSEYGRLHIHVLHFMKDLPFGYGDPNYGLIDPIRREYYPMKKLWKNGFSTPIAVRINISDSWAKIGWRWPQVLVSGSKTEPVKCGHPDAVCNYLSEYLTTIYDYDNNNNRKVGVLWRTRMSRKLGIQPLEIIINKIPRTKLNLMINDKILVPKLLRRQIPRNLLKRLVLRKLIKNSTKNSLMMKFFINKKSSVNIYEQLKSVTSTICLYTLPNFGNVERLNFLPTVDSNINLLFKNFEDEMFFGFPFNHGINPSSLERG